jgi:hypothetical protein
VCVCLTKMDRLILELKLPPEVRENPHSG